MEDSFKMKYLKYKKKYLKMKNLQYGGVFGITKDFDEKKAIDPLVIDEEYSTENNNLIKNKLNAYSKDLSIASKNLTHTIDKKNKCFSIKHKNDIHIVDVGLKLVLNKTEYDKVKSQSNTKVDDYIYHLNDVKNICYSNKRWKDIRPFDYTKDNTVKYPEFFDNKGIYNYAVTCFANSAIHILRSIPELFHNIKSCTTNFKDTDNPIFNFIKEIGNYDKTTIINKGSGYISNQCIQSLIDFRQSENYKYGQQNDAEEFLSIFLNDLYLKYVDNGKNIISKYIDFDNYTRFIVKHQNKDIEVSNKLETFTMLTFLFDENSSKEKFDLANIVNNSVNKRIEPLEKYNYSNKIIEGKFLPEGLQTSKEIVYNNFGKYLILVLNPYYWNSEGNKVRVFPKININENFSFIANDFTYYCKPISICVHAHHGHVTTNVGHYYNYSIRNNNGDAQWIKYNDTQTHTYKSFDDVKKEIIDGSETTTPRIILLHIFNKKERTK